MLCLRKTDFVAVLLACTLSLLTQITAGTKQGASRKSASQGWTKVNSTRIDHSGAGMSKARR